MITSHLINNTKVVTTTEICRRLGLSMSGKRICELGVPPYAETVQGVYWREQDVPVIALAIAKEMLAHVLDRTLAGRADAEAVGGSGAEVIKIKIVPKST